MSQVGLDRRGFARVREAAAFGAYAVGLSIQTASQAHTPVRGGFRSFAPADPKKKGHQIGGTLRRSEHTVAYMDGRRIAGPDSDGNHRVIPEYDAPARGIQVNVGTNSGYGGWVHDGTIKMAGRPFFTEGYGDAAPGAGEVFQAGARRHLEGSR